MSLTVLSVAYPFAPVGPDAVGGSEQILTHIDRALVAAGHTSLVIACEGSRAAGELVPVPRFSKPIQPEDMVRACRRHLRTIERVLRERPVDLIHMQGLDFYTYMPDSGPPVLVSLHLPISWYPEGTIEPERPHTWVHCVSESQRRDAPANTRMVAPIHNGVPVEELTARHAKRPFALVLARVCPEKGIHLAIDAAKEAGVPLLIAGEVFPYEAHERYFAEEIEPRLDGTCRFLGPVGFARKRRLLTAARCLLVPSLVPETSSLVAREAIACGTPVVAFDRGALSETVEQGRTGFLVYDVAGMAEAIGRTGEIDPAACRAAARERFSLETMTNSYISVYEQIVAMKRAEAPRKRRQPRRVSLRA